MTTHDETPVFDARLALPGAACWTLADFLSTYRYWALFLSSLLVALAGQGVALVLPVILMEGAASHWEIGVFHGAMGVGGLLGGFLSFVMAPRIGRSALIWPAVAFASTTVSFLSLTGLWSFPALLMAFGLVCGVVQGAFPIALAVFLFAGRPSRTDFAAALVLLSTTALAANLVPILAFQLYASRGGSVVLVAAAGCALLAAVALFLARPFGFDDAPPSRHRPFQPRLRSPIRVAVLLLVPAIFMALLGLGLHLTEAFDAAARETTIIATILSVMALCLAVAAFVYLGVWLYRIHGELAGAAPSQRLVTPIVAVPIAFLVPFGLPVLLITLGDLLNDRRHSRGEGRTVSIAWLAFWSLTVPPVAVAMIQNAANESYGGLVPGGARR